ncbi:hypothetical protein C1Y40_04637 [Mycobacterium talmoniae]|uniref:Uncharacterized protein n=1 Tax=Mycobacterium talmoniae TaxID=1858794 RepID=A0A2S8BEW1_9MYCO|nr:hypothetical protein C1Y40_04637 [Mycobacterium talmoniae]
MTQPNPADYWNGPAVWLQNPLGYAPGAMMFIGPVLFPAGLDPNTTQTAVVVLGPGGGQFNLPPLAAGESGPSAQFRKVNLTQVPYGNDLPNPPASVTPVVPGGPGVAAVYDLNLALNSGPPGDIGSFLLSQAEDLVGGLEGGFTLIWNAVTNAFNPAPLPVTEWLNVTPIAATGNSAGQVRTLASLTVAAKTYAWVPIVLAQCEVSGTANTQVDLVARLGGSANTQTGTEVGRGFGQLGTSPAPPTIGPSFTALLSGGAGQVAANTGATIYLNCEQQQSTQDQYSTNRCRYVVGIAQVPSS